MPQIDYIERVHRSAVPVSVWREDGAIEAITRWCECIQGKQPLLAALRQLSAALGARGIVLYRHSRDAFGAAQGRIQSATAVVSSSADVTRSYAASVLGVYLDRPRAGSLWLSSLAEESNDPSLRVFQTKAKIPETVVIPLTVEDKRIDFLEIHFLARLSRHEQGVLQYLAEALSRLWVARIPGLFSEAILARREAESPAPRSDDLLSLSNPCGLSRCEFRICLLLSRGLNRSSVCRELAISAATLRTHLRSIYRKTETTSEAELLFALLRPRRTIVTGIPFALGAVG